MKIFAIADLHSDWYPKNAITTFQQYSSFRFVDDPSEADLIWIFSYYVSLAGIMAKPRFPRLARLFRTWPSGLRRELEKTPIIASVHHLTPSREEAFRPTIDRVDELSDAIHFFSAINIEQNQRYFSSPIFHLPYWIDLSLFHPFPQSERAALRRSFNLPEDRKIIGSFQRDTQVDLETPKLEKGPDIFCDVVEALDPQKHFILLAGVRRDYVTKRLTRAGMPFRNLGKVPYREMVNLYNCLDCYLVTARYEGGPQAILEAMATRTPILSTPVGVAEILDQDVVHATAADFADALEHPYPQVLDSHMARIQEFEVSTVVRKYEQTFEHLVSSYRRNPSDLCSEASQMAWHGSEFTSAPKEPVSGYQ